MSNLPGNAASLLNDTGAPSTSGITGEEGREEGTGGEEGGGEKREQERRWSPAEHRGKKKPQRMRRAVVGPRPGAPWVRRGPGPGRHGGRPLAVTPSVHLRPRAGNPEKPPGGLFRVACRRAGPDGARTAAVGGPSSRAVRGLRPVRGQTNETFRRRNEKHPRRVKETETATPTTPETGKTKKQTSGRPALRGRMSPTPLGRPGCRGARRAAAPGRARKVFRTTGDRHGRAPAFIKAHMTQQKQATAPRG